MKDGFDNPHKFFFLYFARVAQMARERGGTVSVLIHGRQAVCVCSPSLFLSSTTISSPTCEGYETKGPVPPAFYLLALWKDRIQGGKKRRLIEYTRAVSRPVLLSFFYPLLHGLSIALLTADEMGTSVHSFTFLHMALWY